MTQTLQNTKLPDVSAYRDAVARLQQLKASESDLTSAISKTEEASRLFMVAHSLPDGKLSAKLRQQREALVVVQQAISQQRHAVAGARSVASREICAAVRQRHNEAQRQMALSLIACNQAALAATAILEELDRSDVATDSLSQVSLPEIGSGSLDPCSRLSYFVRECLQHGLLKRSDVPADWLERWGI
jgi:hypothetical protein